MFADERLRLGKALNPPDSKFLMEEKGRTLTTSMICMSVRPKLNCSGSDSLATGLSSTL